MGALLPILVVPSERVLGKALVDPASSDDPDAETDPHQAGRDQKSAEPGAAAVRSSASE